MRRPQCLLSLTQRLIQHFEENVTGITSLFPELIAISRASSCVLGKAVRCPKYFLLKLSRGFIRLIRVFNHFVVGPRRSGRIGTDFGPPARFRNKTERGCTVG